MERRIRVEGLKDRQTDGKINLRGLDRGIGMKNTEGNPRYAQMATYMCIERRIEVQRPQCKQSEIDRRQQNPVKGKTVR
jgi:hypothetical protein